MGSPVLPTSRSVLRGTCLEVQKAESKQENSALSIPAFICFSLADVIWLFKKSHTWRTADGTVVGDTLHSFPALFTKCNHRPWEFPPRVSPYLSVILCHRRYLDDFISAGEKRSCHFFRLYKATTQWFSPIPFIFIYWQKLDLDKK